MNESVSKASSSNCPSGYIDRAVEHPGHKPVEHFRHRRLQAIVDQAAPRVAECAVTYRFKSARTGQDRRLFRDGGVLGIAEIPGTCDLDMFTAGTGAKMVLQKASDKGLFRLQKVLADDGHSGKSTAEYMKQKYGREFESVKRTERHPFKVMPRRWMVERTFGRLNNFRGLSKHYDFDSKTGEAKVLLGSIFHMTRRLTRPPDAWGREINLKHELKLAHINKAAT